MENIKEIERYFGDEERIVIKEAYDHKRSQVPEGEARWDYQKYPSVYIMFTKKFEVMWCPSGNELRRIYLESPGEFISEPIYVAIPRYLDAAITYAMDHY